MQKTIYILVSIILLISCNTNTSTNDLKLNNGKKWKVNEEMKPHIDKGSEILSTYLAKNNNTHQALAGELKQLNNDLIKSCTMKGESHDELHKWLHPHMKLIQKLSNIDDSKQANAVVLEIEQSFKTYHTFFE
ncbi:hypothetical protein [Aquimarina sediminis]|uniref:hypothetical protein n=1 Tax=Aquimarina sediminis TaxID=2070536 RepID=UPI000CA035DC|nr:hypothetical protein [Aquimarina sediminis]